MSDNKYLLGLDRTGRHIKLSRETLKVTLIWRDGYMRVVLLQKDSYSYLLYEVRGDDDSFGHETWRRANNEEIVNVQSRAMMDLATEVLPNRSLQGIS
jgi:hypothetical protein